MEIGRPRRVMADCNKGNAAKFLHQILGCTNFWGFSTSAVHFKTSEQQNSLINNPTESFPEFVQQASIVQFHFNFFWIIIPAPSQI